MITICFYIHNECIKIVDFIVLDATAKVPSGILRGNSHQFGEFDECLSSGAKVRLRTGSLVRVTGRYCLAHIDIKPTSKNSASRLPLHFAHARDFIKSTHEDVC